LYTFDVVVAIATSLVLLDQYHTFWTQLVGNSFVIFCAKKFASPACFGKVMPKIVGVQFF